jgi:hypothetical protein
MRRSLQRLRRTFGISAPRLSVRPQLGWRWRALVAVLVAMITVAIVWNSVDFGRVLGGFESAQANEQKVRLTADVATLQQANTTLAARASRLEAELKVAEGMQDALSKQIRDLQAENTQLKEELVFLQKLVSGTGKEGMVSIQRMQLEPAGGDQYRFEMLVVQGGAKAADFRGRVQLAVAMQSGQGRSVMLLPDEQPPTAPTLALDFRYYQRIEGFFRVPEGSQVKSVQARVFETGQPQPRATHVVNLT